MFADDSKLQSLNSAASFIQHDFDLFLKCTEHNGLKVQPGKLQIIVFTGRVPNDHSDSGKTL